LRAALVVVALAAGLAGCVHAPKPAPKPTPAAPAPCPTGGDRATAELVFARIASETPGPGVSETDFSNFVTAEIAPRFPDGLTVIDAQDLSPKPAGGAFYGPAKVVVIVLPGHSDDSAQLDAIRAAYKTQFNQQSVLEMTHQACVSF
jgi:hypothetical protein